MLDKQIDSVVTFTMNDNGELYIDIDIENYSDRSIKNFAKLISSLGSLQLQLEAAQIASSGIIEAIPEQLELFISEITKRATNKWEEQEEEEEDILQEDDGKDEKPCIKPSDLL